MRAYSVGHEGVTTYLKAVLEVEAISLENFEAFRAP